MITKDELFLHIKNYPGQEKSELAENFGLSEFTASRLLADLLHAGLVDRVTDHDKRQVYRPALPGRVA